MKHFSFLKNDWFVFFGFFIVCLTGYFFSMTDNFMIDDHLVLFGQIGVVNSSFVELFTGLVSTFYRPVGHIFLWTCSRLFGTNASLYHFANLTLFVVISFLFYKIIEKLTSDRTLALLVAVLYSLHPLNSMLVNYVTANIITTFVITQQLAFLCFLKFDRSKPRWEFYLLSIFFFALSLFSHEMAVMYPAFLFALMYFQYKYNFKKIVRLCSPFIFAVLFYLIFRSFYFNLPGPVKGTASILPHFGIYLTAAAKLFGWEISKLIFPKDLVFLWAIDPVKQTEWLSVAGLMGAVGLSVYLIFFRWKKGIKAFALSLFILGLLPACAASFTHLPRGNPLIEPHWFYFSSIGFFLLIGIALVEARPKVNKKIWLGVLVFILTFYLFLLWRYNIAWFSQETYCRHWIKNNKNNATPYYWLGSSYLKRGRYREAVEHFNVALNKGGFSKMIILTDLYYAHYHMGRQEEAKQHLETFSSFGSNYSPLYYYLSRIYMREQDYTAARTMILKALEFYPRSGDYQKTLTDIEQKMK